MMRDSVRWLFAYASLAAALCSSALPYAFADDVTLTDYFPSPFGKYVNLSIQNTTTVGSVATAGQSTVSASGNLDVRSGDLEVDRRLSAGAGTLRVDSWATPWGGYYVGIRRPANQTIAELQVSGDAWANAFWVSDRSNSGLIAMDTVTEGGVEWAELKAQMDGNNWAHANSVLRLGAQAYLYLNANTPGKIGIGTANPTEAVALQVGDAANPLVIMGSLAVPRSSRTLKKDILPLSEMDSHVFLDKVSALNIVRFRYLGDPNNSDSHIGIIAEQAPAELLDDTGKAFDLNEALSFVLNAIQQLKKENEALTRKIAILEQQEGLGSR